MGSCVRVPAYTARGVTVAVILTVFPVSAVAFAPVWSTQNGDGQALLSDAAGPVPPTGWLYGVNGSLPVVANLTSLPLQTGASVMGSSVLADAHAVYTISGTGSPGQCSTNSTYATSSGALAFVNPFAVNAFSPTGQPLWSAPMALTPADIPCNWSSSIWVQPRMALHPTLPLLYLQASCVSNASSTWAAFLTAVNTTQGACVWTRVFTDAPSPPPSTASIADCVGAQGFQYNYAISAEAAPFARVNASAASPVGSGTCVASCSTCALPGGYSVLDDGALLLLRPNFTVNVLSSLTGSLISTMPFIPPLCTGNSSSGPASSVVASFAAAVGTVYTSAPNAVMFFLCIQQNSPLLNYSMVTLRINPATGVLANPLYNASFLAPALGGTTDARPPGLPILGTADTLYTTASIATSRYATSDPNSIPQVPLTAVYNVSNGTQILSAVTNRAGVAFVITAPLILTRQGTTILPGTNLSMLAVNMSAPVGANVIAASVNFTVWYPRSNSGSPWSAFPLTSANDPIMPTPAAVGSILGSVFYAGSTPMPDGNCSFSVHVLQLQAIGGGAATLSVALRAVNITNASCTYGTAYVVAGPQDGSAMLAVTPLTPSGAQLVYIKSALQAPTPSSSATATASSSSSASASASSSMNASASTTPSRNPNVTASTSSTATASLSFGASASMTSTATASLSFGASPSTSSTASSSVGASASSSAGAGVGPAAALQGAGVSVSATVASVILCSLACGFCGCFTSWAVLTQRVVLPCASRGGRRRRLSGAAVLTPTNPLMNAHSSSSATVLQLAAPAPRDPPRVPVQHPPVASSVASEMW